MTRRRASPLASRSLLTALVASLGCGSSADRSTDPNCVVARGEGFVIRNADVSALRSSFRPPPEPAAASRLALDVWLAEWIETGAIGKAEVRERIGYHNKLANRDLPDRLAELARARAALDVTYGPCYLPTTKSP